MKRNIVLLSVFLILSTLLGPFALSATRDGVTMGDSLKISGKNLVLNGLGTRKATWLKIKVYVGGLYLEKKSNNYEAIANSKGIKHINMHFVRNVGKNKLTGAWTDAFNNAVSNPKKFTKELDKLNSAMVDIKENEQMLFTFLNDGVELSVNGKKSRIEGGEFARALLSVWFVKSTDQGLTKGLLGL